MHLIFFLNSGSHFDPNLSSIILMAVQLFGTYVVSLLVDKFGRKFLMILSTLITSLSYGVMGMFTFFVSYMVMIWSYYPGFQLLVCQ